MSTDRVLNAATTAMLDAVRESATEVSPEDERQFLVAVHQSLSADPPPSLDGLVAELARAERPLHEETLTLVRVRLEESGRAWDPDHIRRDLDAYPPERVWELYEEQLVRSASTHASSGGTTPFRQAVWALLADLHQDSPELYAAASPHDLVHKAVNALRLRQGMAALPEV